MKRRRSRNEVALARDNKILAERLEYALKANQSQAEEVTKVMRRPLPSKEAILSVLTYKRGTGELFWKKTHNSRFFSKKRLGTCAGTTDSDGYRKVVIFRTQYFVHRIIWFIERGDQPEFLDHIDGNQSNNKISNLRAVTQRQNQSNRPMHRKGHLLGTTKVGEKWKAQIQIRTKNGRKNVVIGRFNSQQEAHAAYLLAAKTLV